LRGRAGAGEERRRDLVHLHVGRLRGEHDGDKQGERVRVMQGDRRLGVEVVEDLANSLCFNGAAHFV
jgi:hypothetical protein